MNNNNIGIVRAEICRMSRMKVYKIHIENIVGLDIEGLDFSTIRVEIKNKNTLIKALPLNQLLHAVATIETEHHLHLVFVLLEPTNFGAREHRVFAEGELRISGEEIQNKHSLALGCPVRNIISRKTVVSLAVVVKEDLQKITYDLPDFDPSYIESQPEQPLPISTKTSPSPSPREPLKKLSPLKRSPKKPIRNRHMQYLVKNQSQNFQLNNKVTDEESISVENMKLELDQAISSIQFYGSTYREMLAQVLFKTNPSQDQLKNLKIKVPESQKVIDIEVKTLEGSKLYASTNLPNLEQNECLKISCDFKDENNDIKGKLKFNYKQNTDHEDGNAEKMMMAQQVSMFEKNKLKEQLELLPFLFNDNKGKSNMDSPKFKLPKIKSKESKFQIKVTNGDSGREDDKQKQKQRQKQKEISKKKKNEQQQEIRGRNASSFSAVNIPYHLKQPVDNHSVFNSSQARIYRSKTIHSRNHIRPKSPTGMQAASISHDQSQKNVVKISGVSVKFYKSFVERNAKNLTHQPFSGKFLQMYSNSTSIYRSKPAYSNTTLNWKLPDCEIHMSEYDNLTVQLNLQKEKTMLGQLIISYNQLKFNQEENFLYFGYLAKDYDTIGKICLEFLLIQEQVRDRTSALERTERRTRIKRLYSEDIAYVGNEDEIRRDSPNKASLYQSMAIPTIPEARHKDHKNRLCEQQKQIQLVREKKRSKLISPLRRQKYF